ncbi:hypothetical protein ASPCAL03114 [Aspergillus calidoustus]|uniref:Extracellular membrane protein CFEM domain-containing protein n=1 Tax=Aspergillus calidoustus TaxID=454130 RepID=A0A0U5GU57_ASPCI|nr:hypothetical protein ASPCAL03114 [Aspergillus calidoustus]
MRFRQFLALSSLMLAGNLALAAELDRDDVPDMCRTVCEPVVSAAARCDRDNDNDTSEMNCICNSDQADTRVPQCEACIAQYRSDHPRDDDYDGSDEEDGDEDDDDADPHDNDAYDILTSCDFTTTTYAPAGRSNNGSVSPTSSPSISPSSTATPTSSPSVSRTSNIVVTETSSIPGRRY